MVYSEERKRGREDGRKGGREEGRANQMLFYLWVDIGLSNHLFKVSLLNFRNDVCIFTSSTKIKKSTKIKTFYKLVIQFLKMALP